MESRNGFSPEKNHKVHSLFHLQEVDISRIPGNVLAGFIPTNAVDAPLRAEEICSGSGIWILQCPANVQLGSLVQGEKLYLDGRKKIFENDGKYFEAICLPRPKDERTGDTALVPDESGKMQLVSFPILGNIMINKVMEDIPEFLPTPVPRKVHQLPSGLKVRHPVYGADYESLIQELSSRGKQKRKKRRSEDIKHVADLNEPVIISSQAEGKRKRKIQETDETEAATNDDEIIEIPRKKSKKRHTLIQSETEFFPEPGPIPKKKKSSRSVKQEIDSDIEIIVPKKKKSVTLNTTTEEDIQVYKKTKKSKRFDSTQEPEPITQSKKKRKKGSSYSE